MSNPALCPKCGSSNWHAQTNIPIPSLAGLAPLPDLIKKKYNKYTIYICTNCGYLEMYLGRS
jgi:predicted nucleic-acid-binding Zn-ribbon protein